MKNHSLFGIRAFGCFCAVITLCTARAQNTYPAAPGSYSGCQVLKYTSTPLPKARMQTSSAPAGTATTSSAGQESVQSWVVRSTTETNTTYAVKLTTSSSGEMSMCAYTPNRVLATLMPGKNYSTFVQEMAAEGLKVVRELMRDRNGNPVYIIEAEDTETDLVDQMTMSIESTGSCSLIRPDHIYEANTVTVPNDTNYSSQWALEKIGAPKAWETRTDASSVPVAVLDTGVNYNHYDLNRNLWINNGEILGDGIDNDGNGIVDDIYGVSCIGGNLSGNPMDDNGHGSHCAGIIGAAGNNRQWIAGVAWRASIMALKFLNSEGKGSASDAITCLCYAESKNAKIINCSFGVNQWDDYLYEQILKMSQKGVVFACAAGNAKNGEAPRDNDEYPFYPCNYPIETIVGVAASDTDDSLANFSYYGAQNVDIAAPGVNIYSTVLGTYGLDYKDGTSMATPHVVGALALLMAHYPNETSSDIINRLYAAAEPVDALKGKVRTGARLSMAGFFGISAPVEISVTQGTVADAVVVYWTAVNNGTHYRVWRATSEEGSKTLLCDWQQGLTFADETAEPETTYWYYIQAASSADGASSSTYSMGVSGFRPKVDASRLTVSFNANGGQMDVASKVYHTGEKYAELPVPAYSGKVFLGWFTSAEGGTHLDAESYVRSGVTTLYAHWIDESSLRVENLFARQRYPWNGLVDVTFNLFGVPADETASVSLAAKEENGGDTLTLRTFVGAAPTNLVNGAQHIVWNATADAQAILYTNMILMATVKMDEKPLLPPANITAGRDASPDAVTVTWSVAANASSYEIWRATVNDITLASLLETVSETSFSDKSAVPGVTYYYWVRALNAKKTSEYSASTEGKRKKVPIWTIDEYGTLTSVDLNGITDIVIPDTVKKIGNDVFESKPVSSVVIPDSVTNIAYDAFMRCNELTSVVIPGSVKTIDGFAFYQCENLSSVTLSEGVEVLNDFAFSGCTSLTDVHIPASLKTMSLEYGVFSECSNLSVISVSPDSTTFAVVDGVLFSKDLSTLYWYPIMRNGIYSVPEGVVKIGGGVFAGCSKLTGIILPESLQSIGYKSFYMCTGLSEINFPSRLLSIGAYSFMFCSSLERLEVPSMVEYIGSSAFGGCENLKEVIYWGDVPTSYDIYWDSFSHTTPEDLVSYVTSRWTGPTDEWEGCSVKFLTHTVSFDANGGTVSPTTKSYTVYGTYDSLPTPTRSGYTFNGWYTAASGGTKITASSTVSTSITTLYAQWKIVTHDKVQLWNGGPYWATTNIGAEKPEDYGYYFWWGGTVGYKRENDKWVASNGSSVDFSFNDINAPTCYKIDSTLQRDGWITADGVLAPEHDAAQKHWGGDWRMPTDQEIRDLNNNCDWTWTTQNGVKGYVVRGRGDYSANSIFLPCAGRGYGSSLNDAGSCGNYWSSVPYSGNYLAWGLYFHFHSGDYDTGGLGRDYGQSVRPVQGAKSVTMTFDANGGAVSPTTKVYSINGTYDSLPTPTRSGYTFDGWYTAASGGTKITASSTVSTSITTLYAQWKIVTHDKVQLWENGPYWATTNIGAEKPEDYGYYFWWGDTVGYKRENDNWVASDGSNSNFSFTESNTPTYDKDNLTLQSEGWITAESVLAPEHDAAHVHWGGDWRMPTCQEIRDLNNNCDWTWTTQNGVNGYVVRGRGDYSANSIFLPCAGYGGGTSLYYAGSRGYCWSSVPNSGSYYDAWGLGFYSSGHSTNDYGYRDGGLSVRPVQGAKSVTMTFDANGGAVSPTTKVYSINGTYGSLPTPTRSGYTFNGWYTAASGGTKITASSTVSTSITTLYAQWIKSTYTISFNANGGTGTMSAKTVTIGSSISLPKCTFTKNGYVFAGWARSSTGAVAYGDGVSITPAGNMVLYAVWQVALPNLCFIKPSKWSSAVFLSNKSEGGEPTSDFENGETIYLYCSFGNSGEIALTDSFIIRHVLIDVNAGNIIDTWNYSETNKINSATYRYWNGNSWWTALKNLPEGSYAYRCTLDTNNSVEESNENDNVKTYHFTVKAPPDKVQLWDGGPYWATRNIGAEEPWESGYYFWWGDTVGYKWVNDKWVASDDSDSSCYFSSIITDIPTYGKEISTLLSEGWITSEGVFTHHHDPAHVHWGGNWRMPTAQEIENLLNKCCWTWTTINGVSGYVVRGKESYSSANIFLPCTGRGEGSSLTSLTGFYAPYGFYWSSVPSSDSRRTFALFLRSGDHGMSDYYRDLGFPVRPVQGGAK